LTEEKLKGKRGEINRPHRVTRKKALPHAGGSNATLPFENAGKEGGRERGKQKRGAEKDVEIRIQRLQGRLPRPF